MWFTRVSLHNPVFATMAMLALVVLGWFSLQRLQIDQFPNIDVPTVVVVTEYPGASPEIVESEVSKKIEEAVNPIGGISNLTSRSYEGQSVVVIEFGLQSEGRKAADDVREKVAGIKPLLRPEVKDSRVLRFDPSAKAIWSMAITAEGVAGAPSPVELTRWADQVVKRRLENVRGVGSATVVGGMPRQINLYLQPAALEAFGGDGLHRAIRNAFDAVTRREVLPSMRSLQFGGEAILGKHARIYNCAFTYIDRLEAFPEALYLLLCGCGVGGGM